MKIRLHNDGVATDRDNHCKVVGRWYLSHDSDLFYGFCYEVSDVSPQFKTKRELREWFVSEIEAMEG